MNDSNDSSKTSARTTLTLKTEAARTTSTPATARPKGVIVETTRKRRRVEPNAEVAPAAAPVAPVVETPVAPVAVVAAPVALPPSPAPIVAAPVVAAPVVAAPVVAASVVAAPVVAAPAVATPTPPAALATTATAPALSAAALQRPRGARRLTASEMEARNRALEAAQLHAQKRAAEQAVKLAEQQAQQKAAEAAAMAAAVAQAAEAKNKAAQAPVVVAPAPAVTEQRVVRGDLPVVIRSNKPAMPRPTLSMAKPDGSSGPNNDARNRPSGSSNNTNNSSNTVRRVQPAAPASTKPDPAARDRSRRLTVTSALSDDDERTRSMAAYRRRSEKNRRRTSEPAAKVYREVIVPDAISVQELASRMSERSAAVIKELMKLGIMGGINHILDADTAQMVVEIMGHVAKRVLESDVEIGLKTDDDVAEEKQPRAPIVTVMGHVDHGKTSLLDALRQATVATGEAGGITQHIGAYRAKAPDGRPITFIDTPGHAAFTAMRARGAKLTDIVILVVAADDGVMPQTIEAIAHAQAAGVPIIVAINKIDKQGAKPERVRSELLSHNVVVESMGGDILEVEVSALQRTNLDKLLEAVLLQAEILALQANPNRPAEGTVVESRLDKGRGPVATVLVQRGTLKAGDIVVAGAHWGRVRAITDENGQKMTTVLPSVPAELLGLDGVPASGDEFIVVENEARAREVTEYRYRKHREASAVTVVRSMDMLMAQIGQAERRTLPVIVKADVHGSLEAIVAALQKLGNDEVSAQIIHSGVGGLTESDIMLANTTNAAVLAFNVRAIKQARDLADQEKIDIRYYSVIYDLLDDVKGVLSGLLTPIIRENFLGNAEIMQIFDISKVGKIAGCRITEGLARRSAKVRLVRNNVVIHEGTLSTLRRFKDEVREVKSGYECGMAFQNYEDMRAGDVIEIFETEAVARSL